MPGRTHPLAQYLMVLALMIGAYSVYQRAVVPMLKGRQSEVRRTTAVAPDFLREKRDNKARLHSLLPADNWELAQCKTLFTTQGTLLFRELERLDDDGNYALKPFTMIMNDHQSGTAFAEDLDSSVPPTVLRCAEATLGFDGPILLTGGSTPRMRTASLDGEVTIFRPSPTVEKDETLKLVTRDVKFNANSINAQGEVAFSYGPHRGSGTALWINLQHEKGAPRINPNFSTIVGVSTINLASLHHLHIQPTGLSDPATAVTPDPPQLGTTLFSPPQAPVEITCTGPFKFDFAQRTATFNERVFIQQKDTWGDNLKCHRLQVEFSAAEKPTPPPTTPTQALPQAPSAVSAINRLVATGAPENNQPVVMIAHSRKMKITGDELQYSAKENQVVCWSKDQVAILSPELNIRAKSLTYAMQPDGRLGDLDATGPGEFFRQSTDREENLFLRWQRELTVRPRTKRDSPAPSTDSIQEKIIVIDGQAEVLAQDTTQVTSDKLNIAVYEIATPPPRPNAKTSFRYLPSEIYADSPVEIKSPNLDGAAEKLLVTWPQPNQTALKTHQSLSLNRSLDRTLAPRQLTMKPAFDGLLDARASTVNRAVVPTTKLKRLDDQQSTPPLGAIETDLPAVVPVAWKVEESVVFDGTAEPTKKPSKHYIRFRGDEVRIKLQGDSDQPQLLDLKINGDVVVHQYPQRDGQEKPVRITGNELRIVPQGEKIYRMLVSGTPQTNADIDAQGLQLSGEAIHLDQESNKLWVAGNGTMRVRQPASTSSASVNSNNNSNNNSSDEIGLTEGVAPTGDIDLQWAGGMVFDGSKIYFERNVMMTSLGKKDVPEKSVTRTLSQALNLTLSQRVDFKKLSGDQSIGEINMSEMVLVNHVPESLRVFKDSKPSPQDNAYFNVPDAPIIFQNKTYTAGGKLVQQRRIAVPHATINAQTNQVHAPGPGKIFTHVAAKQPRERSNEATNQSWGGLSALTGKPNENGINFLQVNFEERLVGDLNDKQLDITGNIRVAFAPVANFNQAVDPDTGQLPDGAVKMRCDHMLLSQWQPSSRTKVQNEMTATGNVHLASPGFDAVSNRITYNDGNDQVVVEGSPRAPAKLWHRPTPNAEKQQLLAEKIIYHPSTGTAETQGVQSLNVNISN